MNKTSIIFRHEFLKTLKRPGFIILTLALPVLALLGIGIFRILSGVTGPPAEITKIGYVDESGGFIQYTTQGNISLILYDNRDVATQALINKDITEYFVIPRNFIAEGNISFYSTQRELAPPTGTLSAVQHFITSNLLSGKVPADAITRINSSFSAVTVTLTSTGEVAPQQGGFANLIVPGVFGLLLALSLVFSSAYLLQSLSEEKENRLMEILLSSVSTRQLLTGKILGLGAAGLIQVIVWVITLPLLLILASAFVGGFISTIQVPVSFWILGIVYFVLGYAQFSVLSACVAAITSNLQEASGLSSIYSLFNFVPFWFFSLIILFPNSPIWIVFSIFPFTAPVLVMIRLGVTGIPAWQLATSIIVLILFIFGGIWLASRLLRIYMLMYGKRPKLGTIVRSLRNA
jgi:ABC-2 type transport system permease protein